MAWLETVSATFTARHGSADAEDARRVLAQLERARTALERLFDRGVGPVAVVLHGSPWQLALAQPAVPVLRALSAPAARRYLVGVPARDELHLLAPRLLARRASGAPGSLELLMLAPVALFARLLLAANNPRLPPPHHVRRVATALRWAWLVEGAAQFLSGATAHLRPAVARRLREPPAPLFPPARRDAVLLGGTVFDLLARERGAQACVDLAVGLHPEGPAAALVEAFDGRPLEQSAQAWRSHLERFAGPSRRASA